MIKIYINNNGNEDLIAFQLFFQIKPKTIFENSQTQLFLNKL